MKENSRTLIGFFGIGVFCILTIMGFSYLIKIIIRDINFALSIKPNLNFWTTEFITLLIFLIVSFLVIDVISKKSKLIKENINRTLFGLIGFYILFQLLQFFYVYYGTQYILENNMESFKNYFDYLKEKPLYDSYSSLLVILKYMIFGIMIYIKTKQ